MSSSGTNSVLGLWKLLSARVQMEDTGEMLDLFGSDPQGFFVFGSDGRMMMILSASGRTLPANEPDMVAAFRGMMAYTGRFTVEQNRVVIEVDVAWHPAWENTRQTRFFELKGDRLTLTTDIQGHPSYPNRKLRGIIAWIREA